MILITGATGHIGNTLCRLLLARGERVRALILPGEDCASIEGLAVERVLGDILDEASLAIAMIGVDTVYHLAGIISILPGRNDLMRKVNVVGTRNVARAARAAGVRRLVYTSSIHALGRPPEGTLISEGIGFDPRNPAGEYDRTKAEASLEVLAEVERGLDAVIVCPTGVIGPHDYRRSETGHIVRNWMKGRPHVSIEGSYDFVDVRDVAAGHILAAQKGRKGEIYILAGERISVAGIIKHVQEASGIRSPVLSLPTKLVMAIAPLTELYYRVARKRPLFTSYSLETLVSNSRISADKARRDLGYSPRPIAATIWDTVRWWKAVEEPAARAAAPAAAGIAASLPAPAHPAAALTPRAPLGLALVTGASSGIGAATASALASQGYRVILSARRKDRLESLAEEIRSAGGLAEVVAADLSAADGPRALFDQVLKTYGAPDVLVNNAGFGWYGFFEQMPASTARDMIQVNASAPVQLAVLFLPGMKARGRGHIINVSSVAGSIPSQGVAVYSATKSFVDSFTTALHRELRGSGVHVSAVRPGPVTTEFYKTAAALSSGRRVPAEKFGVSPQEVAMAIRALVRRPRKVAYVPRGLTVVPWVELGFGWIFDRVGPLLLRRQSQRA
jgi:dihydroflavonol-4-reductase